MTAGPKPLSQWIIESIHEELANPNGITAREIYERGVERYEQTRQIRIMAALRRKRRPGRPKRGDA